MAGGVRDIDRGWNRIKAEIKKMDQAHIKAGLQAGDMADDGSTTLAEIGAWNEFGTRHIPERPFVRAAVDSNRDRYTRIFANEARKIMAGERSVSVSLGLIGQLVTSDIQKKITEISTPPNAPGTVARKGSSNPLIDTGRMRQSVRYVIVEGAR